MKPLIAARFCSLISFMLVFIKLGSAFLVRTNHRQVGRYFSRKVYFSSAVMSLRSLRDDTFQPSSNKSAEVLNAREIEEYLQETMEYCRNSTFSLAFNDQHRKSMLRAILQIHKSSYKQRIRELQLREQWKLADNLIRNELLELTKEERLAEAAPKFAAGIQSYLQDAQSFQGRDPVRFFSSLAGGRMYQGKMERLLKDVRPDLLPTFEAILLDLSEEDLIQLFVEDQCEARDDATCQLLQKCLGMTFVQAPSQPMDGGRSKGKRGEVDLQSYLNMTIRNNDTSHQVLSPVWIRERNPAKSNAKQQKYVLEVPPGTMKGGMTNELDAMVVKMSDNDVTVAQVWDAKATMDPTAMHDILSKKVSTLQHILQPEVLMDSKMIIQQDEERRNYDVAVNAADDDATATLSSLPQIGLFGSRFPSPQGAAQKLEVTVCERLLENDRQFVEHILLEDPFTGRVSPPQDVVVEQLGKLIEIVHTIQPILVVPGMTETV